MFIHSKQNRWHPSVMRSSASAKFPLAISPRLPAIGVGSSTLARTLIRRGLAGHGADFVFAASGTPVVVSDQVGLHRVISSQNLGGVAPLDVEPLAAQLNIWLADTDARRDAIARTRPYVFENFEWTRIGQRWAEHYKRLVA